MTSPTLTELVSDSSKTNKGGTAVLPQRDELLLAFCQAAIHAGRRLHGATVAITAWLQRTFVVLSVFLSTVATSPAVGAYLDEHVSLRAAGLASYVQLLQEYLHTNNSNNNYAVSQLPRCAQASIALRLCGTAYPPHILWDRLAESADYLTRLEQQQQQQHHQEHQQLQEDSVGSEGSATTNLTNASKLLDEFVARENKNGIPSHHVRLFVLALAVDHWVQQRATAIRQYEYAVKAAAKNKSNNSNFA